MFKSDEQVEASRNVIAKMVLGRERTGISCVTCGSVKCKSSDFKDELSRKEFKISQMCQLCQDSIFNNEE